MARWARLHPRNALFRGISLNRQCRLLTTLLILLSGVGCDHRPDGGSEHSKTPPVAGASTDSRPVATLPVGGLPGGVLSSSRSAASTWGPERVATTTASGPTNSHPPTSSVPAWHPLADAKPGDWAEYERWTEHHAIRVLKVPLRHPDAGDGAPAGRSWESRGREDEARRTPWRAGRIGAGPRERSARPHRGSRRGGIPGCRGPLGG